MNDVRRPGEKRRWEGWAIISPEDEVYRVDLHDPREDVAFRGLQKLGWTCTNVVVTEK